jgi:small subunit ribosomal protein S9
VAEEIVTQPIKTPPARPSSPYTWGTGRRKTSVARVRLVAGKGEITVNDRTIDNYFSEVKDRAAVTAPLDLLEERGKFDMKVNVSGGGITGQAFAIRLGLARALIQLVPEKEAILRDSGFLTRDSRMKERKKYGQKGARKRFQFSKR